MLFESAEVTRLLQQCHSKCFGDLGRMRTELLILLLHQCSVLANTSEAYLSEGKLARRRIAHIPWAEAVDVVFNVLATRAGGT